MLDHETVRQKLQTSQEAREKESFGALTRMRLFMANAHGIRHEQSHQCSSVIVRLNSESCALKIAWNSLVEEENVAT